MQTSDWDSSEIRAIGRRWAVQAYDIASELSDFGADASALLKPYDSTRPHDVTIPSMLADVVMAVLLALPRQEGAPDQSLGENVVKIGAGDRKLSKKRSSGRIDGLVGLAMAIAAAPAAWTTKGDIEALIG
jgi:hypothetical protein